MMEKQTITSNELMTDLIKILHLPENTQAFSVHFEKDKPAVVCIELCRRVGILTKIKNAFKKAQK